MDVLVPSICSQGEKISVEHIYAISESELAALQEIPAEEPGPQVHEKVHLTHWNPCPIGQEEG